MMRVAKFFHRLRRNDFHVEMIESPCVSQSDIGHATLAETCQFLGEIVSLLERDNAQLRAENIELERQITAIFCRPSQLAHDILLL